jgi:hypothetical protein
MKIKLAFLFLIYLSNLNLFATDPSESGNKNTLQYDENSIFYAAEKINLLKNGDFENGTSYWTLGKYNGGTATFYTDSIDNPFPGNLAKIQSSGSFTKDYKDIQLFSFLEITQNTIYHITFKASVSSECLISASFGNGIDTFFEEKLLLRPEETLYGPLVFKGNADEAFSFFALNLGRTNSTISFDDIVITADNTEKQFNNILANSGINIETLSKSKELYIHLPTNAKTDYPIVFIDEQGKTVGTSRIQEGSQELLLNLQNTLKTGAYTMKVFTPDKTIAYNLQIAK